LTNEKEAQHIAELTAETRINVVGTTTAHAVLSRWSFAQLCHSLSHADSQILFNIVQDTLLNIWCPHRSLSLLQLRARNINVPVAQR
jgi:hypothetical protein